jgi:hypothetical protein
MCNKLAISNIVIRILRTEIGTNPFVIYYIQIFRTSFQMWASINLAKLVSAVQNTYKKLI